MDYPEEREPASDTEDARARVMLSVLEDLQAERARLAEEIEQRRRAEELARDVIDSALDAVITMDGDGRIVEWNAQAVSIFGWTREEALGQELAGLIIPPDLREAHRHGLARYAETQEGPVLGKRLELTALRKTGQEFCVELSVVAMHAGEAPLFNAFLRDITQRGEDAEYRARMAALVDSSYDAIIGKNVDGTIISWNLGAERVYGFSEEDALGKTIAIILPPGVSEEEPQIRHAVRTGQRLDQFETIRRRKDGKLIPVSVTVSPIADEQGDVIGSSTIERDITERRRAENVELEHNRLLALRVDVSTALAANQSRGEALQQCAEAMVQHLDAAFARVWTLNTDTNNLELQASAGLYTHIDGPHSRIPLGEYKIGRIAKNRQPHLTNDVANDPNISSPDWAKREGMVSFAGYPLMIGERVLGVIAMFARRELSQTVLSQLVPLADGIAQYLERKRNEDQLRHAKEAAEQAVRARSEFLANVSHELRTPMNAIIGMTQIALGEDLTKEIRDYVQTANDAAHSLLTLLNDILDFSKLESGKFTIKEEPFKLREMVDETVKTLSARAFEKGLELACRVSTDVPDPLIGDPFRLRQVLTNLIANAIKFTEQGEVVLTVEQVQSNRGAARLKFSVRDTGVGVSADDQRRILEPFTQVDASSTRRHGGTGLGLAICTELAQLMDGRLSVESELGEGSCFTFEVTLSRDSSARRRSATRVLPRGLQDASVLVVDDNVTSLKNVAEMLAQWKLRPDTAGDARQALEMIDRAQVSGQPYQLVIADAVMPDIDGYALARRIADLSRPSPTVVMMLPSVERHEARQRESGVDCPVWLQKPASQEDLLKALKSALQLPVESSGDDSKSPAREATSDSLSILLAEDTPANQKVVSSMLEKRGHSITIAQNGQQAVEWWQREAFDVVLMDVQMPVMDGLQATAAIRQQEETVDRPTPIIAMTAHAMPGDRAKCLDAGMTAYIAKPIDVHELIELVESTAACPAAEQLDENSDDNSEEASEPRSESPPGSAPSGEAIVDFEAAMQRLAGDQELFRDFVGYFDEDAPPCLTALREALNAGNGQSVRQAAHRLKGLVVNFGAKACVAAASEMEALGNNSELDRAAALLPLLEQEFERLDRALETYRR